MAANIGNKIDLDTRDMTLGDFKITHNSLICKASKYTNLSWFRIFDTYQTNKIPIFYALSIFLF
jgi:hypothetical protein